MAATDPVKTAIVQVTIVYETDQPRPTEAQLEAAINRTALKTEIDNQMAASGLDPAQETSVGEFQFLP